MSPPRAVLLAITFGLATLAVACGGDEPRMSVVTTRVSVGDGVVVRFDAPPVRPRERGGVWLTLVPAGSADELVGERVAIEAEAVQATITTAQAGSYELRLVAGSSRRLTRVMARALVDVAPPVVARNEPPAWYW